jgi:hypothetical protein
LIVVAFCESQLGAGADAAVFEEFEQSTVAFVDAADYLGRVEFGVCEEDESAAAAAGGTFYFTQVAVGAGAVRS